MSLLLQAEVQTLQAQLLSRDQECQRLGEDFAAQQLQLAEVRSERQQLQSDLSRQQEQLSETKQQV